MKNYSIVKVGNEYVVRAGEASILRIASRRQAARLVTIAAELLNAQIRLPPDDAPSIAVDAGIVDAPAIPDTGFADPQVLADPSEVS
ncbi:MAG TPA: hypothetical protein VNX23_26295 [Bradyrhizobium sp.]|jgi:hypothetical protein|uniref:hypothetical protein n=1 Tax=Bradyrhizobium sp. TaxID=376 RepID=UPI002BB62830|nr:hypothetical protein [Bradyrhizobium sp.]HXB80876.1 hypothetical protein [Bradyrhizobium sp.]